MPRVSFPTLTRPPGGRQHTSILFQHPPAAGAVSWSPWSTPHNAAQTALLKHEALMQAAQPCVQQLTTHNAGWLGANSPTPPLVPPCSLCRVPSNCPPASFPGKQRQHVTLKLCLLAPEGRDGAYLVLSLRQSSKCSSFLPSCRLPAAIWSSLCI